MPGVNSVLHRAFFCKQAMRYRGLSFSTDPVRSAQSLLSHLPASSDPMRLFNLASQFDPARSLGSAVAGGRTVWMNPEMLGRGRSVLAHEAFHARNPFLGKSETLARFYGGFRGPKGANLLDRMRSGLEHVGDYWGNPQDVMQYGQRYPGWAQGPVGAAKQLGSHWLPKQASALWGREDRKPQHQAWWAEAAAVPMAAGNLGLTSRLKNLQQQEPTISALRGLDTMAQPEGLQVGVVPSKSYAYVSPGKARHLLQLNTTTMPHGLVTLPSLTEVSPSFLAHELGHAQAHALPVSAVGPWQKLIAKARGPSHAVGGLSGLGMLIKALNSRGLTKDERKRLLDGASLSMAAGIAPTLGDEFNASRNALKLLRRLPEGNTAARLALSRRLLGTAGGTYGLMAAGMVGIPQLAKLFLKDRQGHYGV